MKVPQFIYLVDGEDTPRFTPDVREVLGSDRRVLAKWHGGGDFRPYMTSDDGMQSTVDGMVLASLRRLCESGALDEHFQRLVR